MASTTALARTRGSWIFEEFRETDGTCMSPNPTRIEFEGSPSIPGKSPQLPGEFGKRGSEDGIGSAAHFTAPAGIWSDGKNIYVSEVATIRKLAPVCPATPVSNLVWELISPASARFRSIYQAVESKFGG